MIKEKDKRFRNVIALWLINKELMMRDYFYGVFRSHLIRLELRKPNYILLKIMGDANVVFFGNSDWDNAAKDLTNIPSQDRPKFVLCLFLIVITDQALYTYFPASYRRWRHLTNFPKFGWSGFGPHNENPFKLLWAPEQKNLVNTTEVINLIPGFSQFWVNETTEYFHEYLPEIQMDEYFAAIRQDAAYTFDSGLIVQNLKRHFDNLTCAQSLKV